MIQRVQSPQSFSYFKLDQIQFAWKAFSSDDDFQFELNLQNLRKHMPDLQKCVRETVGSKDQVTVAVGLL